MHRFIREALQLGIVFLVLLALLCIAFVFWVVSDMQKNFHGPSDTPPPLGSGGDAANSQERLPPFARPE